MNTFRLFDLFSNIWNYFLSFSNVLFLKSENIYIHKNTLQCINYSNTKVDMNYVQQRKIDIISVSLFIQDVFTDMSGPISRARERVLRKTVKSLRS